MMGRNPHLAAYGDDVRRLLSVAYWLQLYRGEGWILLPQERLAKVIGKSQPWVSKLIGVLTHWNVLHVTKAARYTEHEGAEYALDLASTLYEPPVNEPLTVTIETKSVTSPRNARSTPEDLMAAWNQHAPHLPKVKCMGRERQRLARHRLHERSLGEWIEVIQRLDRSSFCRGNDRGWRADIDFLLKPDTATKVLEGKYDDRGAEPQGFERAKTIDEIMAEDRAERARREARS